MNWFNYCCDMFVMKNIKVQFVSSERTTHTGNIPVEQTGETVNCYHSFESKITEREVEQGSLLERLIVLAAKCPGN